LRARAEAHIMRRGRQNRIPGGAMSEPQPPTPSLKRSFGLWTLVAFGVGDILGAGIYGLIGKVAGEVGSAVWASFLVAFIVAAFTGLSYAELGSRLPHSGGEARYAQKAFRKKWLSYVVGFLVLLSGLVSISTVSHIFAGYLTAEGALLPGFPAWIVRVVFLVGIGVVTWWGIRQASWTNVVCTIVEMCGLGFVIAVALPYFGGVDYFELPAGEDGSPFDGVPIWALMGGGVLAFYSFIGFEDLANVAEEVKDPKRNLPRAIILALAIAAVFYGLVSIAAVSVVPHAELAQSEAPLMEVVARATDASDVKWDRWFTIIALFAVTNTALVNFVMGSRLIYGMARQGLVPSALGRVHAARSTPHVAIVTMFVVTGILALVLELATLAITTSFILLVVFFVVNVSLLVMKLRKDETEEGVVRVPLVVPALGALLTIALATAAKPAALWSFAILAAAGFVLYLLTRLLGRRSLSEAP
jgi:amino acid transporter